jgi:methionyl-tRNA formyltransferase
MRIVFLVNRDVESNLALNLMLPELHPSTVGVFLSERVGASKTPAARMLGQLGFIEQDLFNGLVFPLIDRSDSINDRYVGFEGIERRFGIPVQPIATLADPSTQQMLSDLHADLFVSIRFGRILGAQTLRIPQRGVLNLHSGLLPDYRGVLATFRALMNGDTEVGCTLHWIDSPGIDVGGVIATARIAVDRDRSLLWHVLSLYRPGTGLIIDAIRQLERGEAVVGVPQEPSAGAYYTFPTDDDMIRFTAMGWRLFDRADVRGLLESYYSTDASQ